MKVGDKLIDKRDGELCQVIEVDYTEYHPEHKNNPWVTVKREDGFSIMSLSNIRKVFVKI